MISLSDNPRFQLRARCRHATQKHKRYWSLIRILCWPLRSPERVSRRFPGGTRKSFRSRAVCNHASFRPATFLRVDGSRRFLPILNNFSVAASLKLTITRIYYRLTLLLSSGNKALAGIKVLVTNQGPVVNSAVFRVLCADE